MLLLVIFRCKNFDPLFKISVFVHKNHIVNYRYEDEEPYNEHDDSLVKEYMMKDGGAIRILEMTYINKVNIPILEMTYINKVHYTLRFVIVTRRST